MFDERQPNGVDTVQQYQAEKPGTAGGFAYGSTGGQDARFEPAPGALSADISLAMRQYFQAPSRGAS